MGVGIILDKGCGEILFKGSRLGVLILDGLVCDLLFFCGWMVDEFIIMVGSLNLGGILVGIFFVFCVLLIVCWKFKGI